MQPLFDIATRTRGFAAWKQNQLLSLTIDIATFCALASHPWQREKRPGQKA
jgi:uncharacterized protein CbrC (UPF0167 family)